MIFKKALVSLFLLMPWPLLAQPGPAHLEAQLAQAQGAARLELLVELANVYRRDDPAKALAFGNEALELAPSFPDAQRDIALLITLARASRGHGDAEGALQHGEQAAQQARAQSDNAHLAAALNIMGDASRDLNAYQQALDYALEAVPLYEELGDQPGLGAVLNDAGIAARRVDDYSNALDFYLRSHHAYEQVEDRPGMARAFNNIGIVYRELGQDSKALEFYEQALEIQQQEGNEGAVARLLNNMGVALKHSGEPAQAIDYYLRSMEIKEVLDDRRGVGRSLGNIGLAYLELGQIERAQVYYEQSLKIKEELRDEQGIANTLVLLADVHRQRGRYRLALEALNKSLAILTGTNTRDLLKDAYYQQAETYAAMGRYREALEAFRRYEQVKSEIYNAQNSEVIAEMQARFEADQKVQEIELLKQQQAFDALAINRQKTVRTTLIAGLALLVLIILLLYNRYRIKTRAAHEIGQTMSELRESEQRYARLFDEPSTAKLLIDPLSGTFLNANAPVGNLLNEPVQAVIGRTGAAFSYDWLKPILDRLNGQHEQGSFVEAFQYGDRTRQDFEAWVGLLGLAGRQTALVTLLDVTERRRLQEERVRREERERYIAELEENKAEVEVKNAELERFAYTVSHDLKSPLVTIKGFLGFLQKDALAGNAERMQHDIEQISTATETMQRLLNELLELSRIGRLVNPPELIAFTELAHEAAALVAGQILQRGVSIEIAPDMPHAYGDRTRLMEVLQNLIDNAVKFMGAQPTPHIEIGAMQNGEETTYFVRDNGEGIKPAYHEKIFGLFERLHPKLEGTGIGLALAQRIVEVHGGQIWVESEGEGHGATFFFTLPRQP